MQTRCKCCNNKQRWNEDKCRCESKELINKGICDKGFNWNPSNCECKYGKSCDIGEYSDYKSCKCRKRLVDKLVEECNKKNVIKKCNEKITSYGDLNFNCK